MDMNTTITANDIPNFTPSEIDLPCGWHAEIKMERDDDADAPWDCEDGHGPVREGRKESKQAGERILHDGGRNGYTWIYDFAGAVAIARRDGWGCKHGTRIAPQLGNEHGHATRRAMAECAVEQDFDRLRRWANDDWEYVGVVVTVTDAAGEVVDHQSLWGVESDGDYWREVAAVMVNEIISGRVAANG